MSAQTLILEARSVGGHFDQENIILGALNQVRNLIDDAVDASLGERNTRLPGQASLSTETFSAILAHHEYWRHRHGLPTQSRHSVLWDWSRN